MRMEMAVVKMVEGAREKDIAPQKLARLFELALEKVASSTPVGEQALKIVQTNLLKEILRNELNVSVRVAKGPRKPRTPRAAVVKEKDSITEGLEALGVGVAPRVARKVRRRRRTEEVA